VVDSEFSPSFGVSLTLQTNSLFLGILLKLLLPSQWFDKLSMKESEPEGDESEEAPKATMLTSLNRSFKDKIKKRIEDKLSDSG
jgi:hypothetical protein